MQKNNVDLKKITLNDDLDGLELLKKITKQENNLYSSPVPLEINEYLYTGFLKLSVDEENEDKCFRYWILLNGIKVGYADIKIENNNNKRIGNIGLILSEDVRGKKIGFESLKLLLEKAEKEVKVDTVTITTKKENIPMQKLCEKLGAILVSNEEDYNYIVK